ncbi:MAG: AbrB/MazE/SpoVT family DNA-binding domain-containing protein [Sphingomonadales bacterium]|nr:AbrB/MazE/SpoVT family DNA-binding domain-containing protein [Sphingomonadales bacterium]
MNKPEPFNREVKIVKIGNSAGIILPRDELDRLHLEVGDSMSLSKTPDGLSLTTRDPDFDEQMAKARQIMKRYRNALNELAK